LNVKSIAPPLSADGARAIFQSSEALVQADTDGRQDVYEWEAQATGSCERAGGCIYLLSGGHSAVDNFFYGMSSSGDDVIISTNDKLLPEDESESISLYDVRVNGGFAVTQRPPAECLGEACQPAAVAPTDSTPASSVYDGSGNVSPPSSRSCPKGKHLGQGKGKRRCVKHRRDKHHQGKNGHGGRRSFR
jgi:hypothetical protein